MLLMGWVSVAFVGRILTKPLMARTYVKEILLSAFRRIKASWMSRMTRSRLVLILVIIAPLAVASAIHAQRGGPQMPAEREVAEAHEPVQPIDLVTALRLAGVENPEIQIAQQRVVEAVALRQLAAAQFLPTINAGLN